MPIGLCFGLVATSAWLNLYLKLRYPANLRLADTPAALLLGFGVLNVTRMLEQDPTGWPCRSERRR